MAATSGEFDPGNRHGGPPPPRGVSPYRLAMTLVDRTLARSAADDPTDAGRDHGPGPGPADALAADAAALLGDLAADEGNTVLAQRYYRRVRDRWPSLAASSGVEISLADVLIDDGQQSALAEARQLLDTYLDRPGAKPDDHLFRWHLANLRLADRTGQEDAACESAIMALELATRSQDVPARDAEGTVAAGRATLRWLRQRIGLRSADGAW